MNISGDVSESHPTNTTPSSSTRAEDVRSAEDLLSLVKVSLWITPIPTGDQDEYEDFSVSFVTDASSVPDLMRQLSGWLSTYPIRLLYKL